MDDLASYEPTDSEILELDPVWPTVVVTDRIPEAGEALRVERTEGEPVFLVAGKRLGGRKVRAFRLDEGELETGMPVRPTGRRGGFRLPDDGEIDLEQTRIEPEPEGPAGDWVPLRRDSPPFEAVRAEFAPVETGYPMVDSVAPVVRGGTTLVIDDSGDARAFDHLVGATARDSDEPSVLRAPIDRDDPDPSGTYTYIVRAGDRPRDQLTATRLGVALGADRRDHDESLLVAIELPALSRTPGSPEEAATSIGYGELVDRIASVLVSTDSAQITTLLRLPLGRADDGLDAIVETLDLGDTDAQIFIDGQGRFIPNRSTSDAPRSEPARERAREVLGTIRRAERARDKMQVLGRTELTDSEREALELADEYRTDLTTPPS